MDIGPLLGKGSYGRVYKGRWKGAMVAIKVLDHALILQDDISRETLLSTSIAHPCVVSEPHAKQLDPGEWETSMSMLENNHASKLSRPGLVTTRTFQAHKAACRAAPADRVELPVDRQLTFVQLASPA